MYCFAFSNPLDESGKIISNEYPISDENGKYTLNEHPVLSNICMPHSSLIRIEYS